MSWLALLLQLLLPAPASCPSDMVQVPGKSVCIDRYEWPNLKGVNPTIAISGLPTWNEMRSGAPIRNARDLCESVGKRVCTQTEWTASCVGPDGSQYPWGWDLPKEPTPEAAPCNYAHYHLGQNDDRIAERDPVELERLWQGDPSGTRGCVSASGAEDMMGNVEEWVTCDGPTGWCLMGRYWSEPYTCSKAVVTHAPKWWYYSTGARCCVDT